MSIASSASSSSLARAAAAHSAAAALIRDSHEPLFTAQLRPASRQWAQHIIYGVGEAGLAPLVAVWGFYLNGFLLEAARLPPAAAAAVLVVAQVGVWLLFAFAFAFAFV